jgi:uncharacterized protein (TIGR02996 family)
MTDRDAILEAVRSAPEEDAPRLVFADWLDEHDESPRAEFIRVQCELARPSDDLERRAALEARQRELRKANEADWLGPLRELALDWQFRRGLIDVTVSAPRLLRHRREAAAALRKAGVECLRLTDAGGALASLSRSPLLAGVAALDLRNNDLPGDGLPELVESPHARNLRWLDLRNNAIRLGEVLEALRTRAPDGMGLDLDNNPASPRPKATRAGDWPATVVNAVGMKLARLPAGTFRMGSSVSEPSHERDESRHRVRLSRPFYVGFYPVTQAQYEHVVGGNPSQNGPSAGGGAFHPVERVSWYEAVEYCRRLSAVPAEKRAGRVYRLPTEAEWEYACRGGLMAAFAFGDELTDRLANFQYNVNRTTPVGSYPRNGFGLYDTHGNVREWCADWYGAASYGFDDRTDPVGPADGQNRVLRGGSWDVIGVQYCRCAYRVYYQPSGQIPGAGFRVVLECPPG